VSRRAGGGRERRPPDDPAEALALVAERHQLALLGVAPHEQQVEQADRLRLLEALQLLQHAALELCVRPEADRDELHRPDPRGGGLAHPRLRSLPIPDIDGRGSSASRQAGPPAPGGGVRITSVVRPALRRAARPGRSAPPSRGG
jgi:hypothetical protein